MEVTLNDYIKEYKAQLEKGFIPKAYRSLIEYVMPRELIEQGEDKKGKFYKVYYQEEN